MILSIANQKGGVGKTTTTLTLASILARKGKRVLVIDSDPQANLSLILASGRQYTEPEHETYYATIIHEEPLKIYKTYLKNLHIVPSSILLSSADKELALKDGFREIRLRNAIEDLGQTYDHIFIDCPPALGWLTINAFSASDKVLITCSPGKFELTGLKQLDKTIDMIRMKKYNSDLEVAGYLLTMSDSTNTSLDTKEFLMATYPEKTLRTVIPRGNIMKDALTDEVDVFTYMERNKMNLSSINVQNKAKAALAYLQLSLELKLT